MVGGCVNRRVREVGVSRYGWCGWVCVTIGGSEGREKSSCRESLVIVFVRQPRCEPCRRYRVVVCPRRSSAEAATATGAS